MIKKGEDKFSGGLDEAMNTAGFLEFLARNKDDKTAIEDREKMSERIQTFESLVVVKREFKDLYIRKLEQDLGIRLRDGDMEDVDAYIDGISIDNPDRLRELHGKIDKYKRLTGSIAHLEGKLDILEENKSTATSFSQKVSAFVIDRTYGSVMRSIKGLVDSNKTNITADILSEIHEIGGLHKKIMKRVSAQMNRMLTNADSTEKLQEIQERFEFLRKDQGDEGMNLDLLSHLDEEAFQKKIDEAIERKVSEEILEATLRMPLGTGTLSRLESVIGVYLEKGKIGSREGDDAREMIIRSIELISESLPTDIEGQAKKLALLRIIRKAKKNN